MAENDLFGYGFAGTRTAAAGTPVSALSVRVRPCVLAAIVSEPVGGAARAAAGARSTVEL